jgi:hypothetical protein
MTENELRERVCSQAKSWLGRKEADGTHRVIIDVYNSITPLPRGYRMSYGDPWCAAFVSAVGQVWNMTEILYPECACDPMIELYKAHGRWMEDDGYTPKPGDVIFYDWQDSGAGDNAGSSDHVGLVVAVDGSRITIIEGNCADSVCYQYRQVNGRYIRGYGLPDYASMADGEEDQEPIVVEPGDDNTVPAVQAGIAYQVQLPLLINGCRGCCVESAQLLMIGKGYSVGPWGADGDFGYATEAAVKAFQVAHGLEIDGEIGGETWAALLGVM